MADPRDEDHDPPFTEESVPATPSEIAPQDEPGASAEGRVRVKEISVDEAVQMGIRHHRAGRLPEAEYIYGKVLEAIPDQPDALHFSGVVAHQLGRSEVALERIQAAIAASPEHADMHNNLGRILSELNRLGEARRAFERAIELAPDAAADAWNNLGTIHKREGRWKDAGEAFQRALRADPDHADAYQNLGNVLRRSGQHAEAAACFRRAIELKPDAARDYQNLSQALWRAGQHEEARAAVREWLAYAPDSPTALHLASAFGIIQTSPRASDAFVSQHFDEHADSFDQHLTELQYRAPEEVFAALAEAVGWPGDQEGAIFDCVLDAGCGTGLCGPLLAPMTKRLIGVDLSPGMLQKARERGYDDLIAAELTRFLRDHPGEFDAVISADTLCYFGDLTEVALAALEALRPGGWFVFTVESLDALEENAEADDSGPAGAHLPDGQAATTLPPAPGFRLLFHGRYAHTKTGLESSLRRAGFGRIQVVPVVLRMEVGEPVHGWLVRGLRP